MIKAKSAAKRKTEYTTVDWNASLDAVLKQLIAEREGISPADVTVEYIRRERERRVYPNTRFSAGSRYGGYSTRGLRFRTKREQARISKDADEVLEKF